MLNRDQVLTLLMYPFTLFAIPLGFIYAALDIGFVYGKSVAMGIAETNYQRRQSENRKNKA